MENQQSSAAATALCRAGCGFFGSSSTDGLCSKCFKDSINKKQDTGRVSPPSSITSYVQSHDLKEVLADVAADAVSSSLSSSSSSASLAIETAAVSDVSSAASTSDVAAPMPKSKPNRCAVCKKRVGLTGFVCRCEGLYCSEHRYENEHDCQFDYKTVERELIKKNNPMVMSEKIQRI